MEDEDVIAELTQIRGIGRWTAEMFLMFNLLRPNVLPLDDIGLINAISQNYFSGEPVTSQRGARGRRQLGAVAHGGHVVHVAQPRHGHHLLTCPFR